MLNINRGLVLTTRLSSILRSVIVMLCFFAFSTYSFADNKTDHQKDLTTISQQILNYFDSFKLAQKQKDSVLMADFLYEIAITEQLKGENDSAYVKFNEALAIYKSQNDSLGIANCITQLGSIYRYKGKCDKALANYLKALDKYKFLEDTLGKIKVLNNLGITYRLLNDYPKAISYYSNAERLALEINTDFLATIYNSIGSYYWFQKKNDSALVYYKKAMQYEPEELTLQERRCAILNNIGNVYRDIYKTDSAIYYYFESLKLSTSLGIINLSAITYKNIGKTYYIEAKYDKALRYLRLGNKYAKQSKLAKTIIEIYYIESLIYQDLKQFEKSLEKYKLYAQMQDSVVSSQRMKKIADLEVKYKVQELEKSQALLQNKIIKKDLSIIKNRNYIMTAGFIIIILVFITLSIFLRSKTNSKLQKSLEKANNMLEVRVQQRTYHLIKENEEHKKTEKKLREAKEKAEESDRLKSAFLSNISHEIRTPMNAIVGFSSLLDKEGVSEDVAEYIKLINENGIRLINLIDDIIDLSRINSNQFQLNFEKNSVYNLVKKIAKKNSKLAKEKNLDFIFNCDQGMKNLNICSDFSRLSQVLSNLLSNAIKFTEKGSIQFSCEENGGNIDFIISDTGIGISEEELENIFEPFRTVRQNNQKFFDGVGLGLTLSKEIISMLKGDIQVTSELKKGTTFRVSIPLNCA